MKTRYFLVAYDDKGQKSPEVTGWMSQELVIKASAIAQTMGYCTVVFPRSKDVKDGIDALNHATRILNKVFYKAA